jgi:hypothetical protein
MRPLYFVPDRFSQLLSDTGSGGGVYFSLSPIESEDLPMRILCGRACVLLAGGMSCEQIYAALQIENILYFEKCFRSYNGISPEDYRSWVLSV